MRKLLFTAAVAVLPLSGGGALAATAEVRTDAAGSRAAAAIPAVLDDEQRAGYRAIFASIRDGKWADAQLMLTTLKPGPLHALARAELFTAKGSPKVAVEDLVALLTEAPELPQAEQIARMARGRGAANLPPLPEAQKLAWAAGAPARLRAKSTRSDLAAADLTVQMTPIIKEDRAEDAEALLATRAAELTPEALTEWQQRVAWIYYLIGNDAKARELAAQAQAGTGEWVVHATWTQALAAWRQNDCAAAGQAFERVASSATDTDLRSAGLFWSSRADMACGRPDRVEGHLRQASQYDETFYGLLARQALGMREAVVRDPAAAVNADWDQLSNRPNVRVARALVEVGETATADEVIRQQAKIGTVTDYPALVRLAGRLNLAATQVWLSNNTPPSVTPPAEARYPAPAWEPDGGWQVDRSLVYAHALQESRFRAEVQSPAGAFGLMQIMPAAATDYSRRTGIAIDKKALAKPSTNIAIGQSHLQALRDLGATGGLLPKVIAAYNAGPAPVQLWNALAHDNGDPLLYIESIPYWETRGYVVTVLRNYWMYERRAGEAAPSRAALAQGMWPKFPGMSGAAMVRMTVRHPGGTAMAALAPAPAPVAAAAPRIAYAAAVVSAERAATPPPPARVVYAASAPAPAALPVTVAVPPATRVVFAAAREAAWTGPVPTPAPVHAATAQIHAPASAPLIRASATLLAAHMPASAEHATAAIAPVHVERTAASSKASPTLAGVRLASVKPLVRPASATRAASASGTVAEGMRSTAAKVPAALRATANAASALAAPAMRATTTAVAVARATGSAVSVLAPVARATGEAMATLKPGAHLTDGD